MLRNLRRFSLNLGDKMHMMIRFWCLSFIRLSCSVSQWRLPWGFWLKSCQMSVLSRSPPRTWPTCRWSTTWQPSPHSYSSARSGRYLQNSFSSIGFFYLMKNQCFAYEVHQWPVIGEDTGNLFLFPIVSLLPWFPLCARRLQKLTCATCASWEYPHMRFIILIWDS